MFKKIILGILLITVLGAAGAAIAYNLATPDSAVAADSPAPLASQSQAQTAPNAAPPAADPAGIPVAQGMEGTPWQAVGTITAVDDFGFDLTTENGETFYIELGPPEYWQAQGVELTPGQTVTVNGTDNEGMIHAASVQVAETGAVLQVRTEAGQPLWSGGASQTQGQQGNQTGSADGTHTPNPQVQVDEWITITGTLIAYQGAQMTISTPEGDLITFRTGKPSFIASQGVTFQVGDEISVTGFYEGDQFQAGDITQLSTGQTVLLRDPNGRPLWGGPGNGGGQGGGHGNGKGGQG
jgi:hypothetical protein